MDVIDIKTAVSKLKAGEIGVLRTDTLYGVVALANNEAAVERVYEVKGRTPSKSPIVLIASTAQLFDNYSSEQLASFDKLWPGTNSVILPNSGRPKWLARGNHSIAYRMPADKTLRLLLEQTGPLVAPSANLEGEPPAMTIQQAQSYFGERVDFYIDGGEVTDATPSRLWRLLPNGELERLR